MSELDKTETFWTGLVIGVGIGPIVWWIVAAVLIWMNNLPIWK